MRFTTIATALALAALTAFAVPAGAQEDSEGTTYDVVAMDDGAGGFWFEVEGLSGQNPTIPATPGETITINLANEGSMDHNFHVRGTVDEGTELIGPGETATLTFTYPEGAETIEYQCDPHAFAMKGEFSTASGGDGGDNGGNGGGNGGAESPGFGFAALVAGLAVAVFLVRRK